MKRFFPLILALLGATAVLIVPVTSGHADEATEDNAPETSLKALLNDTEVPLSIKMKQLDADWRRFSINGNSATDMQWQMMGAGKGIEFGIHFTKGQTVVMGGETYLIAYRLPTALDPRFLNWHGHGDPPRPRKPSDETELSLSLLNLRTTGSLNDVRPFDAEKDMINTAQSNAASVKTLTQLGQGVMRYLKARGTLPYLNNPIPWDAGRAFYPYVGDERLYMHPATQEMYRYNEILGGKKIAHIKDRQSMVVFYEATAGGDDTRGILFLDGHVERLSAARWAKVRKASKIRDDGSGTNNNDTMNDETAQLSNSPQTVVVRQAPVPPGNTTVVTTVDSGY